MPGRNYHVVPFDSGWAVKKEGSQDAMDKASSRDEAIEKAWSMAFPQQSDVVIHAEDGSFDNVQTYESRKKDQGGGRGTPSVRDVMSVGTRLSWSALLAGAVLSITVYFGLLFVGTAVGLTVEEEISGESLAIGATLWAGVSVLLSLFLGGAAVSMCTAGETKGESVLYGLVLWGVIFIGLLAIGGMGVRGGFSDVLRRASGLTADTSTGRPDLSRSDLEGIGLNEDQANKILVARQEVRRELKGMDRAEAAWWALGGLILSICASIGGALVGAGPRLRYRPELPGPSLTTRAT